MDSEKFWTSKLNPDLLYIIIQNVKNSTISGPKQSEGGSGFRPEVDFLEIRRADGTFGSDLPFYSDIKEWCPDAEPTYPGIDPEIQHNLESAVHDFDLCTSECGGKIFLTKLIKVTLNNLRRGSKRVQSFLEKIELAPEMARSWPYSKSPHGLFIRYFTRRNRNFRWWMLWPRSQTLV